MTSLLKRENNPYTLQFSYIPPQYILRKSVTEEIIGDYMRTIPAFRGHFITGVRGTGKTVMMAEISRLMGERNDWIVVDIENPESNILDAIARGLYRNINLKKLFINAKIDLSVLGIGVSIEQSNYVATNEADAMDFMLKILKKEGKRVLVTIDEVTYCKEIAAFSHTLSAYARAGYEIYVLMTGLKENIKAIKNDKSLTFLYRAKEHVLESLNITAIIANYSKVFNISREMAEEMAYLTKGYSFAFQTLGYLYWEALCKNDIKSIDKESILAEYDQYLSEFSYEKIWSEIPAKEKKILRSLAKSETGKVQEIREIAGISSSEFSVYRDRLIDRGLICGKEYGYVRYTLPRFGEFAVLN